MSEELMQQCLECGIEKPLTTEFWHKDSGRASGMRTRCKECVRKLDRATKDHVLSACLARLEMQALDLLNNLADPNKPVSNKTYHVAELYERITFYFGGADGFARQVAATYFSAVPGSQIRQRILGDVGRMAAKVSDMGAVERDLRHVSTEDLERLYNERCKEHVLKIVDKTVNEIENASDGTNASAAG